MKDSLEKILLVDDDEGNLNVLRFKKGARRNFFLSRLKKTSICCKIKL